MFKHFKVGHSLEVFGQFRSDLFRGPFGKLPGRWFQCVQLRHQGFTGLPQPSGTLQRNGLGQHATTATDALRGARGEFCTLADVFESGRIDIVQGLEVPIGIPPAVRQGVEFRDFVRVEVCGRCHKLFDFSFAAKALRSVETGVPGAACGESSGPCR